MTVQGSGKECTIDVSSQAGSLCVALAGEADMGAAEGIRAALADAHDRALSERSREVVVDVVRLEFMNSTCLKALLGWIARVEPLDATVRYKVRLISSSDVPWQKRTLQALVNFAPDLVTLDVIRS